jgi:hypothetical protein
MERARRIPWYLRPLTSGAILFSVLAIACGISVLFYAYNRANAIDHIRTRAGEISFGSLPTSFPGWMRKHWPEWAMPVGAIVIPDAGRDEISVIPYLREVRYLELPKAQIADDDLRLIADLPSLEYLDLTDSTTSDAAIAHLRRLPLRFLFLQGTAVTDAGIAMLGHLPLHALRLNRCRITDAGVDHLNGLNLQVLSLSDTDVTDACVPVLVTLPLTSLELEGTAITDAGVADLAALPLLSINLSHSQVTNRALDDLGRMRTLEQVWLSSPSVTRIRTIELAADLRLSVYVRSSTGSHENDATGVHLDVLDWDFRGTPTRSRSEISNAAR